MFLALEEVATPRVGELRFGIHLVQIDVVRHVGHREGIGMASLSDLLLRVIWLLIPGVVVVLN